MTVVVDSVSKSYGSVHALRDVSLRLDTGITGLLGPNGAGKTTLLSALGTVLRTDTGRVTVDGRDAYGSSGDRIEIRRRLGYLPQEVGFPRSMTAFGFVEYIAVLKEWDEPRAGPGGSDRPGPDPGPRTVRRPASPALARAGPAR
jgi:ABC-2 type transport system ATP-binding protein